MTQQTSFTIFRKSHLDNFLTSYNIRHPSGGLDLYANNSLDLITLIQSIRGDILDDQKAVARLEEKIDEIKLLPEDTDMNKKKKKALMEFHSSRLNLKQMNNVTTLSLYFILLGLIEYR